MNEITGLNVVLLGAATLGVLAAFGLALRQMALASHASEMNRLLREQLAETSRGVGDLGRDLAAVRSEAREEAARAQASAAQMQAEHLARLQEQVNGMAGLTQQQLSEVRQALNDRMAHLSGTVGEQLGGQAKVMLEVQGQLGGLAEAAKNMHALGKDIAGLQDILRTPKLRGNLGELFLEEILRQVLPTGAFEMQYRMPGLHPGTQVLVDAVVHLGNRLVPIDSKFPLESFQRLLQDDPNCPVSDSEKARRRKEFLEVVRRHIDTIADKYICPESGTYDFALAYLPAENIYYEAVIRDDGTELERSVVAHAARRKVIPVSPNTLYAYLLTVAYGLKGLRIEQQAEAIRGQLANFQKKFATFYGGFEKVGRNLDLAQRGYEDAVKRALKLHDQVSKITGAADALDGAEDTVATLDAGPVQ